MRRFTGSLNTFNDSMFKVELPCIQYPVSKQIVLVTDILPACNNYHHRFTTMPWCEFSFLVFLFEGRIRQKVNVAVLELRSFKPDSGEEPLLFREERDESEIITLARETPKDRGTTTPILHRGFNFFSIFPHFFPSFPFSLYLHT